MDKYSGYKSSYGKNCMIDQEAHVMNTVQHIIKQQLNMYKMS